MYNLYNYVMSTVQCSTINSYIAVIYFLIRINIHIKGTSFYALNLGYKYT